MCTWSRDVGRPSRGYQEGNLPGGEIIILQAAQGGEFTCWEGSAVSEMQSWSSRARAENCGGVCVCVGVPLSWLEREIYSHSGRPEVSESQIMTVLHAKCKHRVE